MESSSTELYLIRHAESEMNTAPQLIGGRSNHTPLTERGEQQALELGEHLRDLHLFPDSLYASPAIRTLATAKLCLKAMGVKPDIIVDDALQELDQGRNEGLLRGAVYTEQVMSDIMKLGKDFRFDGGESMNDVGKRMALWANTNIAEREGRHFAFTHGGGIKYWASLIMDWPHLESFKTPVDNASYSLFRHDGRRWRVEFLNHNAYSD